MTKVSAASAAKSVDPIFAVRYARLLSALRQGLLADPGLLWDYRLLAVPGVANWSAA